MISKQQISERMKIADTFDERETVRRFRELTEAHFRECGDRYEAQLMAVCDIRAAAFRAGCLACVGLSDAGEGRGER